MESSTPTADRPKQIRGFAAMDPEKRKKIAALGGKTAHAQGKAHRWTPEQAREAGRKGGSVIGQRVEHMRTIGRRGGRTTSADNLHMSRIGRLGGQSVSRNSEHMAAIGRKGGSSKGMNSPTL